jgi:hypothetical protein
MSTPLAEILRQKRASVFFHAPWSGPSNVALRALRDHLSGYSIQEDEIAIIDVDTEEKAICLLVDEGVSLHGYGEAAVIRDGKIRHFSVLGRGDDTITMRIDTFLNEHRA